MFYLFLSLITLYLILVYNFIYLFSSFSYYILFLLLYYFLFTIYSLYYIYLFSFIGIIIILIFHFTPSLYVKFMFFDILVGVYNRLGLFFLSYMDGFFWCYCFYPLSLILNSLLISFGFFNLDPSLVYFYIYFS